MDFHILQTSYVKDEQPFRRLFLCSSIDGDQRIIETWSGIPADSEEDLADATLLINDIANLWANKTEEEIAEEFPKLHPLVLKTSPKEEN